LIIFEWNFGFSLIQEYSPAAEWFDPEEHGRPCWGEGSADRAGPDGRLSATLKPITLSKVSSMKSGKGAGPKAPPKAKLRAYMPGRV
jgi:hypothetical protein